MSSSFFFLFFVSVCVCLDMAGSPGALGRRAVACDDALGVRGWEPGQSLYDWL